MLAPRAGERRPTVRLAAQSQGYLTPAHAAPPPAAPSSPVSLVNASRWGLVPRNVALLVDPPRGNRPAVQPFTPEQARVFLDAVQGDRLEALYTVALSVDLRQGEALSLRWEDVNLEQRRLSVRYALQRIGGKLQLVEPKTAKSRRTLALPAFAVTALRAHKVRQLEERVRLGAHWRDTGFIFTSSVGTPLEARNVVRHFHAVQARIGIRPRRRFHDLRHSAASLLLAQGEDLRGIMELLGHSQISLTANLYAHVLDASKRQTADRMDALFGA